MAMTSMKLLTLHSKINFKFLSFFFFFKVFFSRKKFLKFFLNFFFFQIKLWVFFIKYKYFYLNYIIYLKGHRKFFSDLFLLRLFFCKSYSLYALKVKNIINNKFLNLKDHEYVKEDLENSFNLFEEDLEDTENYEELDEMEFFFYNVTNNLLDEYLIYQNIFFKELLSKNFFEIFTEIFFNFKFFFFNNQLLLDNLNYFIYNFYKKLNKANYKNGSNFFFFFILL